MNRITSQELAQQRCFNHMPREAVARCPECHRFYCRECITEHGIRLICASCLKEMTTSEKPKKATGRMLGRLFTVATGFFLAWLVFYLLGRLLLTMTDSVH